MSFVLGRAAPGLPRLPRAEGVEEEPEDARAGRLARSCLNWLLRNRGLFNLELYLLDDEPGEDSGFDRFEELIASRLRVPACLSLRLASNLAEAALWARARAAVLALKLAALPSEAEASVTVEEGLLSRLVARAAAKAAGSFCGAVARAIPAAGRVAGVAVVGKTLDVMIDMLEGMVIGEDDGLVFTSRAAVVWRGVSVDLSFRVRGGARDSPARACSAAALQGLASRCMWTGLRDAGFVSMLYPWRGVSGSRLLRRAYRVAGVFLCGGGDQWITAHVARANDLSAVVAWEPVNQPSPDPLAALAAHAASRGLNALLFTLKYPGIREALRADQRELAVVETIESCVERLSSTEYPSLARALNALEGCNRLLAGLAPGRPPISDKYGPPAPSAAVLDDFADQVWGACGEEGGPGECAAAAARAAAMVVQGVAAAFRRRAISSPPRTWS